MTGDVAFLNTEAWVQYGVEKGFCSPSYCSVHDISHADDYDEIVELIEDDDGDADFCWPVVRIKI